MTFRTHYLTIALLAGFGLALGACGGGGSAPTTTDPGDSLAGKYIPDGATFSGLDYPDVTITAASGESVTLPGLGTVECASDDGCSGTVADGTLTITGHLKIVSVAPELDDETAMAIAAVALDMLPKPPGPTPAEIAAMTKAAKTKLDAIVAEAALTTDSGLGGTDAPDDTTGSYDLTVKRDSMATTVTVSVREAATADPDEDEKFMATDLGGGLSMHTREHDAADDGSVMTEIAMVMTDIAAPKAVAFAKWQAGAVAADPGPQALDVRADGETVGADNPADSRDLGSALVGTTPADAAVLKLVMADQFAAPGEGASIVQHTFLPAADDGDPDTPGNQPRAAAMVGGTYNGAMGTYTCSGTTNCTVTVNAKGELTAASDGWIFTPAEGATSDQPDYDYLNWGFWLKKTTEDGVTEYDELALFHGNVGMTDSSGTVQGLASYEGSAVGVYVHNVNSDGGGSVESRTAGHFTADVSLSATFGQITTGPNANTIAPADFNTITGTINKFVLSGDEPQDWSVALKGGIGLTGANDDFNGSANGGGEEGAFSGNFYGAADTLPGAASGEFNANFSNGSVAGAFGTRKE